MRNALSRMREAPHGNVRRFFAGKMRRRLWKLPEQFIMRRKEMDEQNNKRGIKKSALFVCICGVIAILAGAALVIYAGLGNRFEKEEPKDIVNVKAADVYAYTPVQYMTESFAFYEANRQLQFYLAFDNEWNASVVCVKDSDLSYYQPYIDWLYSDSYENEPEMMYVTGYSQRIDSELEQLVIEMFEAHFGPDYVDSSNFENWFGRYYLNVGQKNTAYEYSTGGIVLLVMGILLTVLGVATMRKKQEPSQPGTASAGQPGSNPYDPYGYTGAASGYTGTAAGYTGTGDGYTGTAAGYAGTVSGYADASMYTSGQYGGAGTTSTLYTEPKSVHRGMGILGAFCGALLGGIIWTIIGVLGYVSGWIGLLIIWLAVKGYTLFAKEEDKIGWTISIVFGLLIIAPATYASNAWVYYQALNESIPGYTSLWDAFVQLPAYLTEYNEWGTLIGNLVMGYLFAGVAAIYMGIGVFSGKHREKRENKKNKKKNAQVQQQTYQNQEYTSQYYNYENNINSSDDKMI